MKPATVYAIARMALVPGVLPSMAVYSAPAAQHDETTFETATVMQLLAEPDRWHQKRVRVRGTLSLKFEGSSISDNHQRLWLDLFREPYTGESVKREWGQIARWQKQGLEGKRVVVLGIFDKNEKGHLGMWSGGLKQILSISRVSTPDKSLQPTDPTRSGAGG